MTPVLNIRGSSLAVVIQSHTDRPPMMTVVLSDNTLRAKLPEPCIVIRTRRDQVCTIRRKGTIPDPALMSMKRGFEWKGRRVGEEGAIGHWRFGRRDVGRPYSSRMVGGAGGQMANIG